jgi:hypothetical protein
MDFAFLSIVGPVLAMTVAVFIVAFGAEFAEAAE